MGPTDRQTDGRQTVTLRLLQDAAMRHRISLRILRTATLFSLNNVRHTAYVHI